MDFTIDNTGEVDDRSVSTFAKNCMAFIEQLEDGKFITCATLAERSGYSLKHIQSSVTEIPKKYRVKVKHEGVQRNVFGNERTVEAWEKK